MPRREAGTTDGEVELLIESRDGDELEEALSEQLAQQGRRQHGRAARRAVVAVEVIAGEAPVLSRPAAVTALRAAERDLVGLLGRLRKTT